MYGHSFCAPSGPIVQYIILIKERSQAMRRTEKITDLTAGRVAPGREECVETNSQMNQAYIVLRKRHCWPAASLVLSLAQRSLALLFPPAWPLRQSSNSKKLRSEPDVPQEMGQGSFQKHQLRYGVSWVTYPGVPADVFQRFYTLYKTPFYINTQPQSCVREKVFPKWS